MVVEVLDVVGAPGLGVLVPHSDFVLVVICDKHVVWQLVNARNCFDLDSGGGVRIGNLS